MNRKKAGRSKKDFNALAQTAWKGMNLTRGEGIKTLSVTAMTLFGAILFGGCSHQAPFDENIGTEASAYSEELDGLHVNGLHVNGLHVNGLHVNGLHVNGLHVNGTTLNGFAVEGMTLQGTVFTGSVNGVTSTGDAFEGASMTASLEGGDTLQIRIDTIDPSPDPEILLYGVSYLLAGSWKPLCTDEAGQAVRSFPLHGYWDESEGTPTGGSHVDLANEFTFACQGYALAKCAEIGYKPWKSVQECLAPNLCHQVPLSALHQACTRMMRADYCGNGVSTTREGTLIDVADQMGFETSEAPPGWLFEGEWGEDGATCVKATRWPTLPSNDTRVRSIPTRKYIKDHCPLRWASAGSTCGTAQSTFFVDQGFETPIDDRSLLTTRILKP